MSEQTLMRVRRQPPVVTQVYQELRRAVLEQRFRAGERLVETDLADRLGVSRTPVREALSRLEVEGLLESLPNGGVAVRDFGAELLEIYGLRQRLEGYAANLAAQRIGEAELAELAAVCDRAREAVDSAPLKERAELNNRFHRLLTEASHSPRLIRMANDYRDYFLNDRMLSAYDRDTALRHHRQHRQIVEALRQRDGERAERLVREHFASALDVIRAALTPASDAVNGPLRQAGEAPRGEGHRQHG